MTTADAMTLDATTVEPAVIAAELLDQLERGWNSSDGAAYGAAFQPDSEFVDVRGGHHRGVLAIADGHQALFDSIYAGSTIRFRVDTARVVVPGCVVAVGGATMEAPGGPMRGTHRTRCTAVITEADGRWSIASFHNTVITER